MTQAPLNKRYTYPDGRVSGHPPSQFDSIGIRYITWQHNFHKACRASVDPDGAREAVWQIETVGLPRAKLVYVPMTLHAKILSVVEDGGRYLDASGVKALCSASFLVKQDAYGKWKPWNRRFAFVAYLVPVDFHRPEPSLEATLVQPATLNLATAAARFVKTLATALDANGSEIDVDGAKVLAVPRSASLGLYSGQHDNADTARRVHDRDLDAAIEACAVRREPHDGDAWLCFASTRH